MSAAIAQIDARLAELVHPSARDDAERRPRHERFLVSRLSTGAVTLAGLPPYLLWRGVPSPLEALAVACLVLPVAAAVLLSRTGRLGGAHALSAVGLAGVIACLCLATGGSGSAAVIWLAAVPLEAMLSGSRRGAVAATAVAVLAAAAVALGDAVLGPTAENLWPLSVAAPVFAIAAIGHAAALAVEHLRREANWRAVLRTRDARDRSLLRVIDDVVTWHDRGGAVVQASASALKLIGVAPETLHGRGLLARVHVPDRPAFLKAISDAALCTQPVTVQFRLHIGPERAAEAPPAADPVIWVEMRAHRAEAGAGAGAEEGGEGAVVAVTRDVSEHRRRADAFDAARAEAERANESKSRFLATVSHELRTPLNAIIGFSEMLAAEEALAIGPERRREYSGIIRDSGRHLLDVVNTLLDMSKIQSGNFDLAPEPLDAAALARGCCDLMHLRAEQAGVALQREIAGDLPELVADARALRQILINLLSNAVKFTPCGGRVEVGVRRERDRLRLTVADTGIGIAEADLARLGDPFFQAGSAYDRAHEGTGLGLSVVRGLVGLHGGEVAIESAPGAGTAVTVILPLDCRTGHDPRRPPERTARITALPRRGGAASTAPDAARAPARRAG